jgi:hypothetical protein
MRVDMLQSPLVFPSGNQRRNKRCQGVMRTQGKSEEKQRHKKGQEKVERGQGDVC